MRTQRSDRAKVARQLGLGQRGMDFVVADLVQQDGGTALAALKFRHKVMQALPRARQNAPATKRADW